MNTLFPIICSLVIFLFPFAGKFRYSRQALNSIVISLGLLGTFAGITYSLLHFDPENITSSLPLLLTGLKTSILTIISGVVTSLLLKLSPGFYGIRREKETSPENLPETLKEMLKQLIAIKDNIHKAGVVTNPDGSVQATELFQDKALYDLARNTSQIMQKQSQYLSITQEENRRLYEQLQQLLQASQHTNENLETLLEKGIRQEESRADSEPATPVMKEILSQLIAIKDNIHKAGVVTNPDGSVQATELFQDKALYDLARNTSQIMQKQSQYLSITQEENKRLYDQLETLLLATQATNKNLETLIEKGVMRSNRKITAQVDELSQLVKNTGDQVTVQIKQMNEKRAKEAKELIQFAQTMQSIIKKLNQSHNALYKGPEENGPESPNTLKP